MRGSDKFLLGVVVGVILLIVAALAIFAQPPEPSFVSGNDPESVLHNYLLALIQGDDERAYGYLSPALAAYPETVDEFQKDLLSFSYRYADEQNVDLVIVSSEVTGDEARVEVRETVYYDGDMFSASQYTQTIIFTLEQVDGEWKVSSGDYYFAYCWNNSEGCY
jgi:hypothetical protein